MASYGKQYNKYITQNVDSIVDKFIENSPGLDSYRKQIASEVTSAVQKLDAGLSIYGN